MLPANDHTGESILQADTSKIPKYHPAGCRIAKFCLNKFQPEILANSQTTVLHTLMLLKDTLSGFKSEDVRSVCESLLSIMTASNILIRMNSFQVLHSFFASRSENINGSLCAKLLAAIYEYRPDQTDVRQTIAWVTVIKEGHIYLANLDLKLCMNSLAHLIDICATDLWMSDRLEIVTAVSNVIKEVFYGCVKLACTTQELSNQYRVTISRILDVLSKVLATPFGDVSKHIILTFSIIFEVCGEYF